MKTVKQSELEKFKEQFGYNNQDIEKIKKQLKEYPAGVFAELEAIFSEVVSKESNKRKV